MCNTAGREQLSRNVQALMRKDGQEKIERNFPEVQSIRRLEILSLIYFYFTSLQKHGLIENNYGLLLKMHTYTETHVYVPHMHIAIIFSLS